MKKKIIVAALTILMFCSFAQAVPLPGFWNMMLGDPNDSAAIMGCIAKYVSENALGAGDLNGISNIVYAGADGVPRAATAADVAALIDVFNIQEVNVVLTDANNRQTIIVDYPTGVIRITLWDANVGDMITVVDVNAADVYVIPPSGWRFQLSDANGTLMDADEQLQSVSKTYANMDFICYRVGVLTCLERIN